MIKIKIVRIFIFTLIFNSFLFGFKRFAYISYDRVFLIEVINPNKVIFNFINLSEFVKVIEASQIFLYKKGKKKIFLGQVFEDNNTFLGSFLVKSWDSGGLTLWGKFELRNSNDESFYVYREGKFFKLEGLTESEYDYLYMLLSNLNLTDKNVKMEYIRLGIPLKGYSIPEEKNKKLLKLYNSSFKNGVNPPKILKAVKIKCPSFMGKLCPLLTSKGLNIKGIINKNGDLINIEFPEKFEKYKKFKVYVINFLKLNFLFLPATLNGDVVNSKVKFKIFFR